MAHNIAGQLNYDNAFWRFSLAVYGEAEVAKECLGLQDDYGIDVNILLFCAWLGTQSVRLTREDIEATSQAIAGWHDDIVRPLRTVRQRLKDFSNDEKFRAGIKNVEIEAEQIEQAMLFALFQKLLRRDVVKGNHVATNVCQYIAMKTPANAQASAPRLIDAARRF